MNLLRFIFRRVFLIFQLMRKHFLRSLFSSLGLFLSMLIVISIIGILRPIKSLLIKKVEQSLPSEIIRVRAKAKTLSPLASLLGANKDLAYGISEKQIKRIKKWREVETAYLTQILQKPAKSHIPVVGLPLDLVMQGVEPALVKPYLSCMKSFRSKKIKYNGERITQIPIVIPESIPEVFYAYSMITFNAPVNLKLLLNKEIDITINRSSLIKIEGEQQKIRGKLCGFVPTGIVSLVGVPLSWVKKTNRDWQLDNAASHYDQVFVRVKDYKSLGIVKKRLKSMGLIVPKLKKKYSKLNKWLQRIDYIFWGIALVLLTLTSISLINSFTLLAIEKRYEFGLYLVFGSSSFFLWFLLVIEGLFWGSINAIAAILVSSPFLDYLQKLFAESPIVVQSLGNKLQDFSIELTTPEKYYLVLASSIFSAIASLVPGMVIVGRKTLHLVRRS